MAQLKDNWNTLITKVITESGINYLQSSQLIVVELIKTRNSLIDYLQY